MQVWSPGMVETSGLVSTRQSRVVQWDVISSCLPKMLGADDARRMRSGMAGLDGRRKVVFLKKGDDDRRAERSGEARW